VKLSESVAGSCQENATEKEHDSDKEMRPIGETG
jgi:hypothetical protein